MNSDKHFDKKLSGWPTSTEAGAEAWTNLDDNSLDWSGEGQRRIQVIISRAVMAYLLLFFISGLIMSAMGLSPLVNGGLVPKTLLVFVGLALIIALINNLSSLSQESGLSLSMLVQGLFQKSGNQPK